MTNALNIASELAVRPNLRLVVTGGVARSASYELVGPLAEASLNELNLDMAILGVDGISAEAGLTTHHEVEAHTNLALMDRARRVIVVTDGSKIGHAAFASICGIERVHDLITDTGAPAEELAAIAAAGVARRRPGDASGRGAASSRGGSPRGSCRRAHRSARRTMSWIWSSVSVAAAFGSSIAAR